MRRPWIVLIAFAALMLVACGSDKAGPTSPPVPEATSTVQPVEPTATAEQGVGLLAYTRWVLEELNGSPAPDDALTVLMFTNNWASGRVGCLEGFPSVEFAADGSLKPYERDYYRDDLCGPDGPGASATAIVEAAAAATHYVQTPGRLELRNSDDQPVLVFRQLSRETELDDTVWAAVTIHGQPILEGTDVTLRFSNGGYSGSDGCYGIGGDFMVPAPGQIFWSAGEMPAIDCPETVPGEGAQRERFDSIIKAPAYQLTATTLELFDVQGNLIAEFVSLTQWSGLEGVRWQLTTLNGSPVPEGANISLIFQGVSAVGWTSCNNYGVDVTGTGGDGISFEFAGIDEEGCQPGMPEPEYTDTLESVTSYQVAGETLTLFDAAGEPVLIFGMASGEADLGGRTWQLFELNDVRLLDGNRPVFSFRDGEIVAHTLCTEYRAGGLAFDGTRITIAGPISVWEHSCEEPPDGHTYNTQLDLSDAIASIAGYWLTYSNRNLGLVDNTGKVIMMFVPAVP